ncbi:TolC family protein [Pseudomonas syringae]|uniref:TolC family protein n=1 Tax=Pseudomonas syringae TaxID=317 RepID=UPI00117B8059
MQVPDELPSSLLQRRPDVLSAEHSLKWANIDVGAARVAFFPGITLTASAGSSRSRLSGLFKSATGAWCFSPGVPIGPRWALPRSRLVSRQSRQRSRNSPMRYIAVVRRVTSKRSNLSVPFTAPNRT